MSIFTFAHWDFASMLWVEIGVYGSENWVQVAGVERMTPPQREIEEDIVFNHSSPGRSEEVIATYIKNGMTSLVNIYDGFDDDYNRFHRDFETGRKRRYQNHIADGQGILHFTGFVKKAHFGEFTKEKAVRQQVDIRNAQNVWFQPGASA